MTKARAQVTCYCSRYSFPHRLKGGNCTGDEWAASYMVFEHTGCHRCNCMRDGVCEVALGQESIAECEGKQDHERRQPRTRHPQTEAVLIGRYCDSMEDDLEEP